MAKEKQKRGLATASLETRVRVAALGGRASHGGGRPKVKKDEPSTT